MPLWTDILTPVEASGIARAMQSEIERAKGGTLARYLPNVQVDADHVIFFTTDTSLVDVAHYRAYNSPPKIGAGPGGARKTISLPAISRNEPIDEQTQKAITRLSDDRILKSVESAIRRNVQAISDRQELTRGVLIETGNVVVSNEPDFHINDQFGRHADLTFTAPALWSATGTDRLTQLETWCQLYASHNGGSRPGAIRMSPSAFAALARGDQFQTILANGASRPAWADEVRGILTSHNLPPIDLYDRQVRVNGTMTNVLDPTKINFLPAPVDPEDEDGSDLGATYWGLTTAAQFPDWGIEPDEQPGIVCGIFAENTVGAAIEVQGDSCGEPVARNANASMTVKVV